MYTLQGRDISNAAILVLVLPLSQSSVQRASGGGAIALLDVDKQQFRFVEEINAVSIEII